MCFGAFRLHAAPTERDRLGIWGYKHIAPPEQEPQIPMMTTFRAKLVLRSYAPLFGYPEPFRFSLPISRISLATSERSSFSNGNDVNA